MVKFLLSFMIFLSSSITAYTQTCTNPGQTPSTAFPVCGSSVFSQSIVPFCGGRVLPTPGCAEGELNDINPYWYKFTCFQAGTLGLLITPVSLQDDYDWQLYDITGRNPDAVYTDGRMVVAANWSGETGLTGASAAGRNIQVCGGLGRPLFSSMPMLVQGHDYLLLISNFSRSQSGYNLEFKGGTAVITDPAPSALKTVEASCAGDKIRVGLSKKMKCNSLAANGSDFSINVPGVAVIGARGITCISGFDMDSLELTLSSQLLPGTYTLSTKTGGDGNTLLDNCNAGIPVNNSLTFEVLPRQASLMDSLAPVGCAPRELKLVFDNPILCNTIAADGTDFLMRGPYAVSVTGAQGSCSGGLTNVITVLLDRPLQREGDFTIELQRGSDGNTLLNECTEESPAASLPFSVKDTVNAGFSYTIQYGCSEDLVDYFHDGANGVNSWDWDLDENLRRSLQNPLVGYRQFNVKRVQLIVSNGFCSDTAVQTVMLDNFLEASFQVFEDNCPLEPLTFNNSSRGKMLSHEWNFGDGNFSADSSPVHVYQRPEKTKEYKVTYTATDSYGCSSVKEQMIKIYVSCYIDIPNAFSPNSDGMNDWLYPLNAVKAEQLEFRVYNRWGQLLFRTSDWKKGWDGRYNNSMQSTGLYVWTLRYTDRDTRKQFQRRGTVLLNR